MNLNTKEKEIANIIKEISVLSLKDGDTLVVKIEPQMGSKMVRKTLSEMFAEAINNSSVKILVIPKEVDLEVVRKDE